MGLRLCACYASFGCRHARSPFERADEMAPESAKHASRLAKANEALRGCLDRCLHAARANSRGDAKQHGSRPDRACDRVGQVWLSEARRSALSLRSQILEQSGLFEALKMLAERSNIPGTAALHLSFQPRERHSGSKRKCKRINARYCCR